MKVADLQLVILTPRIRYSSYYYCSVTEKPDVIVLAYVMVDEEADMVVNQEADTEVDEVADMDVDKVADMVANKMANEVAAMEVKKRHDYNFAFYVLPLNQPQNMNICDTLF